MNTNEIIATVFLITFIVSLALFFFLRNISIGEHTLFKTKARLITVISNCGQSKVYYIQCKFICIWFTLRTEITHYSENTVKRKFYNEDEAIEFAKIYIYGKKKNVKEITFKIA